MNFIIESGGRSHPGTCPICSGPTTQIYPDYLRCRACGWQGHVSQTEGPFHVED